MADSSHLFLLICFIAFFLIADTTAKDFGDSCSANETAPVCGDPSLACVNNICECAPKYTVVEKACRMKTNEACGESDECIPNAVCTNGKCICKEKFTDEEHMLCTKELGDNCTSDADCGNVALTCNAENKVCKCASGYVEEGKNCKGLAGASCDMDMQCVQNSDCAGDALTGKKCTCVDQYKLDSNHTCSKVLNSDCVVDANCSTPAQICHNKTCACAGGYQVDANNTTCTYVYGSKCKADSDCGTVAMKCSGNKLCECNFGFSFKGGVCNYNYMEQCTNGSCGSPTMFCNGSKCDCLNGTHTFKDGICKAALGEICVGSDCLSDFATCTVEKPNKTCQCNKDYEKDGEKCMAPPNALCSTNDGCKDIHSKCTEVDHIFHCTCDTNYEYNKDSKKCAGSTITGSLIAAAFAVVLRLV